MNERMLIVRMSGHLLKQVFGKRPEQIRHEDNESLGDALLLPSDIKVDATTVTNEDFASDYLSIRLRGDGLPAECDRVEGEQVREGLVSYREWRDADDKWHVAIESFRVFEPAPLRPLHEVIAEINAGYAASK